MGLKKIWVFYGGPSSEREVSLSTGKGIVEALKSKSFEVEAFDVKPGADLLKLNWQQPPDLVYLALHGTWGEDGTVQGFLDSLKIKYVGCGVSASATCFHKILTKKILQEVGIPTPNAFNVQGGEGLKDLFAKNIFKESDLKKKWFIKAARQGSTIGVERYEGNLITQDHRRVFEETFAKVLKFDEYVLIEEWIEGPELAVTVFNGRALPLVEIRPLSKYYNYESKYTAGKTEYLCPAPLDEKLTAQIQQMCEKAFVALECRDYGRFDVMLGADGPRILEMNTLPGMTPTSLVPKAAKAAGMDYATFVEKLVNLSYERQSAAK